MRPRFGVYGVAFQLALAVGLGLFVAAGSGGGGSAVGPFDHVNRGIVLGLLFAVPGVIAGFGVRGGRPALLAAAVAMDMAGVLLSFAALVFIVPAGLFVAHAAATARTPSRIGAAVRAALVGTALVVLVVGAGTVLLTTTESRCWTAYSTPTGIEYRFSPFVGNGAEIQMPLDAVGSGCETGVMTTQGEATAAVLAIGAIALAGLVARRREDLAGSASGAATP